MLGFYVKAVKKFKQPFDFRYPRSTTWEDKMKRMPTGINTLDKDMGGGIPLESFNLLYGKTGTRKKEFTHTIAHNSILLKQEPDLIPNGENLFLPERIWYAVLGEEKEDILRNIKGTFSEKFYERFANNVSFKIFRLSESLSDLTGAINPGGSKGRKNKRRRKKVISQLMEFLNKNISSNIVFLYSLTDLVRIFEEGIKTDITSFIQFVQKTCRKENGLVFSPLTKGIVSQDREESIISRADCIFEFETSGKELKKRQNIMHVKKCEGVPSDLNEPFRIERSTSGIELERVRTLL